MKASAATAVSGVPSSGTLHTVSVVVSPNSTAVPVGKAVTNDPQVGMAGV